jgi:hypothetical protein
MKPTLNLVCASLIIAISAPHAFAQTPSSTSNALMLKRVSLSSSGVGYFEYEAQVSGKATLSLPVALDKVDDVLKSLVIYDAQGSIGGVSLPGLDPIAQTLKQLPFDASALNAPASLLEALRGADISVGAGAAGKSPLRGRIVSVQSIAATDKDAAKHQVMLMTAQGMQQFVLETAENLQFEDPALREQIGKALAALSNNRAKDARSIDIISEGAVSDKGPRTVRVGYVTTVPIWKNAYRFTLPSAALKTDANAPSNVQIQGWAVIENMSGQDWTNVQLTLTAGKPVAFSQQLYRSYYNNRPQVAVELPGSIVPVADNGTFREAGKPIAAEAQIGASRNAPRPAAAPAPAPMGMAKMANASMATTGVNFGFVGELSGRSDGAGRDMAFAQASDTATVQDDSTQASYTFGLPVTVGSGRSLSIPIIQNELPMSRVALYQPNVNGQFPLAAIELNNTSQSGMPAGAATLYEATNNGNQFVGDAQLNVLPASDKRYVAYALDQKLSIAQRTDQTSKLKGYSLKGANLNSEYAYENMAVFTVKSTHNEPRDVVVEVPVLGEGWELVTSPTHSAIGKTASAYRRNIVAAPKETIVVGVRQERTNVNIQHLQNFDVQNLRNIVNDAQLAPTAKPVLLNVIALMDKRNEANAERTFIDDQLSTGRENQNRIRENLKSVPVNSAPHNRYMDELNKADAQYAEYQAQLKAVMLKKQAAEGALRDYLAGLK